MSLRKVMAAGARLHPPSWLPNNLCFETVMGSAAYGVSSDESDVDVYGICLPPKELVFPHLAGEIPGFGTQLKRFEQWQDSLGLARNVLAARLKHLVAHGVFETRVYCERPQRHEYLLTEKGRALRGILLHMVDWGQTYVYQDEKPLIEGFHTCGHRIKPVTYCAHCQQPMLPGEVERHRNPDAKSIAELARLAMAAE